MVVPSSANSSNLAQQDQIDVISHEKWHEFQKMPYERDFCKGVVKPEKSIITCEEDIMRIWKQGGYLTKDWNWHIYCPTKPKAIIQYISDMFTQTSLGSGSCFCDLGIGTSFVQAAFAAMGFRTYGVDIEDKALDYSNPYQKKVQKELGAQTLMNQ